MTVRRRTAAIVASGCAALVLGVALSFSATRADKPSTLPVASTNIAAQRRERREQLAPIPDWARREVVQVAGGLAIPRRRVALNRRPVPLLPAAEEPSHDVHACLLSI